MKNLSGTAFLKCIQCLLVVMVFTVSFSVQAEDPNPTAPVAGQTSGNDCSFEKFKNALGGRESGGNYGITNTFNYLGKYQFGESALKTIGWYNGDNQQGIPGSKYYQDFSGGWSPMAQSMGVNSYKDFLACMTCQEKAMDALVAANQATIRNGPLASYIGKTVNGTVITESGLVAACHLKGCGGTLSCLQGGGCTDGYGTSAYEYAKKFGGYDMANAAGDGTCKQYANTSSPRSATNGNPLCAEDIFAEVSKQVNAIVQSKNQIVASMSVPPTPPSSVANTPCMSQQMASITNKFSNAPSNYANQIVGGVTGNPVGTLVSGVFRSGYNSTRTGIASWPQAIGLQSLFNKGMTSLFQSLGLQDSPFASDLCGLMLDTMLSYVQCSTSFNLPSLGNLPNFNFGGGSCESQIARDAAYRAASKSSFDILADQPGKNLPRTIPTPAKTNSGP